MNSNHQTQWYKCENCFNKLLAGNENPRWTNDATHIYRRIFCSICKRGYGLSTPYSIDPNIDPEKIKITESSEFKKWRGNHIQRLFSEEDRRENERKLRNARWGYPEDWKE